MLLMPTPEPLLLDKFERWRGRLGLDSPRSCGSCFGSGMPEGRGGVGELLPLPLRSTCGMSLGDNVMGPRTPIEVSDLCRGRLGSAGTGIGTASVVAARLTLVDTERDRARPSMVVGAAENCTVGE